MTEKIVYAFTDGACKGNPGPGGWGVLLKYGEHQKEIYGGERETTNNRMELLAAIMALESLTHPCTVQLATDSSYVAKGISQWLPNWIKRDWKTASKEPVKNVDLWQRLELARSRHRVQWVWVKGHAGHPENERADQLANLGVPG